MIFISRHFNLQCRINDSQTTESVSIASTKSTNSVKKQCDICLLGDDFMRLLISYELFQTDYTDKRGKMVTQLTTVFIY